MADSKISDLTLVTSTTGDDVFPLVNGGTTKKIKISQLNIPSIAGLATTTYVDTKDNLKVDKVAGKVLSDENFTSVEKTKLGTIASGATVNSSDATLLSRANHTGTQLANTISDFNSTSRAQTESELVAGTNITIAPSSSGATRLLTISSTTITNLNYSPSPTNGIVTNDAGSNATLLLADVTNAGLLSPSKFTILQNTSNSNSGDDATNSQYSGLAASKQNTLISATNIKTINGVNILGSGNLIVSVANGVVNIVNDSPNSFVFGTLTETVLGTYLMSSNTILSSSGLTIKAKYSKPLTNGTATIRIKINNSNNFATATTLATYISGSGTAAGVVVRNPCFQGGNILITTPASTFLNDESVQNPSESTILADTTNDIYFFVSIQNASILDTTFLRTIKIIN